MLEKLEIYLHNYVANVYRFNIQVYLIGNNILDEESKLLYVAIDIVRQQGSDVIVANGLAQGDRLIISALDYPVDGMKLALIADEEELEEKDSELDKNETQMANNKDSGE